MGGFKDMRNQEGWQSRYEVDRQSQNQSRSSENIKWRSFLILQLLREPTFPSSTPTDHTLTPSHNRPDLKMENAVSRLVCGLECCQRCPSLRYCRLLRILADLDVRKRADMAGPNCTYVLHDSQKNMRYVFVRL